MKVLVEGHQRAKASRYVSTDDAFTATRPRCAETLEIDEREQEVLMRSAVALFDQYVKLNKKVPPEVLTSLPASTRRAAWPIPWPRTCR